MFELFQQTTTLAQATGANGATTSVQSSIEMWLAAFLVITGAVIALIAGMHWLRGRRATEEVMPVEPVAVEGSRPAQRLQVATPSTQEAQNLLRLMGEAEELCTRLGRDLDDKAQRLERLLARAEGRLGPGQATVPEPTRITVVPPTVASPYYQPPSQAPHARPEIVTRPVAVPSVVGAAAAGSHQQGRSTPDPFGLDPLSLEIYRLSDAGIAPNLIAQQLGQHTGKVELILALRSR